MSWLTDSRDCLTEAREILEVIKQIYDDSVLKEEPPSNLKAKILTFLVSTRGPLDYAANHIYKTFCDKHYLAREKKNKIIFPIARSKSQFDHFIAESFKGLDIEAPEVLSVLRSCQIFNRNEWLKHLQTLSNTDKHVNLSRQKRSRTTTINHMQDINGNTFSNVIISDNKGIDFAVNGTTLWEQKGFIKSVDATVEVEYLFSDLGGRPVVPTLENILKGVTVITDKLDAIPKMH